MSPPRFEKPSAALEARFAAALPDDGALEHKRMFGYPAVFVHGHYFAGLVDQRVVVKLPDGLHERLPALRDAEGFDPMGSGRAMQSWFVVPAKVAGEGGTLKALLAAALPLVAALPAKVKKGAKAKKPTKAKAPPAKALTAKAKPKKSRR